MSESPFEREVRDTIVKSGLTGVAATMLAVTIFSPAGLGGMIGTSVASGHADAAGADNPYASLAGYPAPLTNSEISDLRGTLASNAAKLEFTHAATNDRVERVRAIAASGAAVRMGAPAPVVPVVAPVRTAERRLAVDAQEAEEAADGLRLARSEPAPPAPAQIRELTPVSYVTGGGGVEPYLGSHEELADLMFADENF